MIDETNSPVTNPAFPLASYRQLAELRFRIRQYLQFSEQVARTHGLEPQQHQLMLTIKGLPANAIPTVSALANRLCLRHHSTVELINRLVERGAAVRIPSVLDRRQVLVELTPLGEELLDKLSADHQKELEKQAHELLQQLRFVLTTTPVPEEEPSGPSYETKSSPAEAINSDPDKLKAASA